MSFLPYSSSPTPTNNFLSAFARSFESFLQSSPASSPSQNIQSPSYDQNNPNSKESISAILSTVSPARSNISFSFGETPSGVRRNRTVIRTTPRNDVAAKSPVMGKERSPLVQIDLTRGEFNDDDDDIKNEVQDLTKREARQGKGQEAAQNISGRFPYNCNYCKKGFRKETTLILHHCAVQNALKTPSECSSCGKRFVTAQSLHHHKCLGASVETPKVRRSTTAPSIKTTHTSHSNKVEIDVPVTLVNTEIVFQEPSGLALIVGDIIELDPHDGTLEEAIIEGSDIETLDTSRSVVAVIREESQQRFLPDAREQMALVTGMRLQDIDDIFSHLPEHSQQNKHDEFPWQRKENEDHRDEVECLFQEVKRADISSNLDESYRAPTPLTPANVSAKKMIARNVSLQKFTYFNDTPQTIAGSEDDSDDDDWAATKIKCKPCKKVFSSKTLYRKHLKTHSKVKKIVQKDIISSSKGPQKSLEKIWTTLEEF